MTASTLAIVESDALCQSDWSLARHYRRQRPLEQRSGWRAILNLSDAPRRMIIAALLAAIIGHALVLALWWQERPQSAPPLPVSQRISVQLWEAAPELVEPALAIPPGAPTPAQAPTPNAPASRPPLVSAAPAEVAETANADAQSSEISIDWASAMESAARAQIGPQRNKIPIIGAPVPPVPGTDSQQWSAPSTTPAERMHMLAKMFSGARVGGGGLYALTSPNFTEQQIDANMVDLQSECQISSPDRIHCPPRRD